MAKQDFYAVLGAARDASADDLKKAYRKLAMQYHPDRNPGDKKAEAKFKELNEAYDVLKDPEKRAAYDRFGHAAFDGSGGAGPRPGGPGGFGGFQGAGSFADMFDDIFGDLMGGGRGRGGPGGAGRGADLQTRVELSLEEAFAGKKATLRVPTAIACEACKGSGSEGGAAPQTCGSCNGAGKIRAQQGFFLIERTCPTCGGTGKVVKDPCKVCAGAGRVQRERTLNVDIPAGVEDGTRMRVSGAGEAGLRGAPPGDLYVNVMVRPHKLFQREGANLYCRVPLRMTSAALGGAIEVPTIEGGRAKVTINAGTQTGDQFRLRGKGMTQLNSAARGDLYIQVAVETPMNLTKKQQELLRAFEEEAEKAGDKSSPESAGFFAKMREFFEGKS
ncbi:molecular chaperone DnaJ [Elioraea rosea]|uniref:molecular chaperone DnaJ n=1 Tax=Elioraea rosea TaxID=2492390 RepID=UPI001182B0DB|nr:molecular chaperone DnaJ [Elioraea rosea]